MVARYTLDIELDQLNEEMVAMGCLVEGAIESAFLALQNKDTELAKKVIASDDLIDDQERRIEQRCLLIIARQQPLAGDLRTVGAALKVITDLERIGDHCTDICEVIERGLAEQQYFMPLKHIPLMVDTVRKMVREALDAYIRRDVALAHEVRETDDTVDNLLSKIIFDMSILMREQPQAIDQAVDFMFIGKHLERMADHATNVAEWATYLVTGRHPQDKDLADEFAVLSESAIDPPSR